MNIIKYWKNQFLELNDILLFSMCIKCVILTTKHVVKKIITSNQSIFVIELFSFKVNKVHINVCT